MDAHNAAFFGMSEKPAFLRDALSVLVKLKTAIVVTDDNDFLPLVPTTRRASFASVGLDASPLDVATVRNAISASVVATTSGIIIDMRWLLSNMEGVTSLERWGHVADQLATAHRKPTISVYDQDLIIEEQMQVSFRAHRYFLAPSGLHANPYWMPSSMLESGSLDVQLAFMLGRAVPDYAEMLERRRSGELLARGATPSWLQSTPASPSLGGKSSAKGWHIHCFGPLRVVIGGKTVDWRIGGSTPKKTRTLFAYLLQTGGKGAHAEQLSELLWPEEESEEIKRTRLHHTIAMLRKTLGSAESVHRNGDYYRLNAPQGSWIDIDTFEQLCRRGLALLKKGDKENAMRAYLSANQLYVGDLFEDLPREYAESELENWCIPRRIWLHEMALKLQTDLTRVLINTGRTREALEYCMKALALDPASENANADAMRILEAQGRHDAVQRQYRQYKQAVAAVGATESAELKQLLQELTRK